MYSLCQDHAKRVTRAEVVEEDEATDLTIKNSEIKIETTADEILVAVEVEIAAAVVEESHPPRKMVERDTTATLTVEERKETKPDERVVVAVATIQDTSGIK